MCCLSSLLSSLFLHSCCVFFFFSFFPPSHNLSPCRLWQHSLSVAACMFFKKKKKKRRTHYRGSCFLDDSGNINLWLKWRSQTQKAGEMVRRKGWPCLHTLWNLINWVEKCALGGDGLSVTALGGPGQLQFSLFQFAIICDCVCAIYLNRIIKNTLR